MGLSGVHCWTWPCRDRMPSPSGRPQRLRLLDPWEGWQGQVLRSARAIAAAAPVDVPVLLTVFSPLTQAKNLCGAASLADHWRHAHRELMCGLGILGENARRMVRAARTVGIHGIYYVIQECGHCGLTAPGYVEACGGLDRSILNEGDSGTNWVHLHGNVVDFAGFARYPAAVLHWDEKASGVSLETGAGMFPGIVSGGITWPECGVVDGPLRIRQTREAVLDRMAGLRFILSASCVVPYAATDAEIRAAGGA